MTDRQPTEIEIVCLHYLCADDERRREEYGKTSRWKCPRCGKLSFYVNPREGTAGCKWECAVPDELRVPGAIAYLGDYHPRTQQREINRERRAILEAHERRRVDEERTRREWGEALEEMEVREYEREFTLEERRAAVEMLRKDRAGVLLSPRHYEAAAARSARAGSRVLNACAAITEHEAKLAALWFVGALLVVFYGVGYLESFASYAPLDAAFYVPLQRP